MGKELISIVVPIYNAEKYIFNCVESIERQSYKNYELILVNDGSCDRSKQICDELAIKNNKIIVINKKNGGAADARNVGIDRAKGAFLCFVDADDYIHENYLEVLYANIIKYGCDISMCQFQISHKLKPELIEEQEEVRLLTNIEAMYECCSINKTVFMTPWCKLFKKELFREIRFPVGRTFEDLATLHKVMYKAEKIVFSNLKMYSYYMSPNSVMRKKYSLLNFNSENQAQDERIEFYRAIGIDDLYQKLLISVQRNRVANYCKASRYLKTCREERKKLLEKYKAAEKEVDFSKCNMQDKVLFLSFKISKFFCAFVLFPMYERKENRKWS